jgi:hypothetical protein
VGFRRELRNGREEECRVNEEEEEEEDIYSQSA